MSERDYAKEAVQTLDEWPDTINAGREAAAMRAQALALLACEAQLRRIADAMERASREGNEAASGRCPKPASTSPGTAIGSAEPDQSRSNTVPVDPATQAANPSLPAPPDWDLIERALSGLVPVGSQARVRDEALAEVRRCRERGERWASGR